MGVTAKPSGVQSSASSGTIPDFPNFAPGLIQASGGQETNAEIQGWWNVFKFQVLQQNNNLQNSIRIVATATGPTGTLQAEIDEERIVRADADQALADDIIAVEASIAGVTASVVAEAEARATADGHLSANYSITVTAGSVVTGMQLNSSLGGGVTSSTIDFQAANFRIWDGTGTAYPIFSTSVGLVKLASTLTVNTAGKVFTGVGTYGNNNTPFYVDSSSNFSLGADLTWNGTTLTITGSISATSGTIGGWTVNATTISHNNAVLDSAGNLALGTANDIVIISATDSTYRLWIGNVTAGSATFRVTKGGVMTATGGVFSGAITSTSGAIGGWTIGATTISSVGSLGTVTLDSSSGRIRSSNALAIADLYADDPGTGARANLILTYNSSDRIQIRGQFAGGSIGLFDSGGSQTITISGAAGSITATSFVGSGASLTAISASNISSGTLDNARLPTGISVSTLGLSGALTMTNSTNQPLDLTDGTVNFRSVVNHGTARANWGTTTNHSIEIFTDSSSRFFFGSDGHFKTVGGDFRKVTSDGWTPILYDGANQLEFQASGGAIYGRINGGSAILLG